MNNSTKENKEKLIKLGGKEWVKDDMNRVYITCDILNILLEEKGLMTVNFGERNNKIFFDIKSNSILRSYKNKKPVTELELS